MRAGRDEIIRIWNETDKQLTSARADAQQAADLLQGIIDGCAKPETAVRRALLPLEPIREFLAAHQRSVEPSRAEGEEKS